MKLMGVAERGHNSRHAAPLVKLAPAPCSLYPPSSPTGPSAEARRRKTDNPINRWSEGRFFFVIAIWLLTLIVLGSRAPSNNPPSTSSASCSSPLASSARRPRSPTAAAAATAAARLGAWVKAARTADSAANKASLTIWVCCARAAAPAAASSRVSWTVPCVYRRRFWWLELELRVPYLSTPRETP